MKYIFPLLVLFTFSSCKKDNNNSRPSTRPYLSLIKYHYGRTLVVDSFFYDTEKRLTDFTQHRYDTNGTSVAQGRLAASFQYNSNDDIPHSYVLTGLSQIENHSLSFDSQNRIIKDTSLNGTHNVVYYSYSDVGISSAFLFGGDILDRQLDSIFIVNGNVSEERIYYSNNSPIAEFSGSAQYEYSSSLNPTYQPAITPTIGPLLHILIYDGFGGFTDFASKNLFNKMIFRNNTNTTTERNCIWSLDSNGNVISGRISGPQPSYFEFSYY